MAAGLGAITRIVNDRRRTEADGRTERIIFGAVAEELILIFDGADERDGKVTGSHRELDRVSQAER